MAEIGYLIMDPSADDDEEFFSAQEAQEFCDPGQFVVVVVLATEYDALLAKVAEQEAEIERLRNPDLTEAVERAAKANFNRVRDRALADGRSAFTTEWDDLPASERHVWREHLVPIVVAALWRGTR